MPPRVRVSPAGPASAPPTSRPPQRPPPTALPVSQQGHRKLGKEQCQPGWAGLEPGRAGVAVPSCSPTHVPRTRPPSLRVGAVCPAPEHGGLERGTWCPETPGQNRCRLPARSLSGLARSSKATPTWGPAASGCLTEGQEWGPRRRARGEDPGSEKTMGSTRTRRRPERGRGCAEGSAQRRPVGEAAGEAPEAAGAEDRSPHKLSRAGVTPDACRGSTGPPRHRWAAPLRGWGQVGSMEGQVEGKPGRGNPRAPRGRVGPASWPADSSRKTCAPGLCCPAGWLCPLATGGWQLPAPTAPLDGASRPLPGTEARQLAEGAPSSLGAPRRCGHWGWVVPGGGGPEH